MSVCSSAGLGGAAPRGAARRAPRAVAPLPRSHEGGRRPPERGAEEGVRGAGARQDDGAGLRRAALELQLVLSAAAAAPATSKPVRTIPLLAEGKAALARVDAELGLAFDEQDVEFYIDLFQNKLKRDPTDVELFDLAQSNSEHSRHWFFGAKLVLDGQPAPATLMQLVKETLKKNPGNSVIGFKDNSSAIRGGRIRPLLPATPGKPGPLVPLARDWDILLTAETHNFPCAVAPYPGAETGAGGRIRDTHATGIGSMMGASTAGYCVGNLGLGVEGEDVKSSIPSEDSSFAYPPNLASPLQILLDSSNGASDYGNKFGEPLVAGYTRTFGLRVPGAAGTRARGSAASGSSLLCFPAGWDRSTTRTWRSCRRSWGCWSSR